MHLTSEQKKGPAWGKKEQYVSLNQQFSGMVAAL